MALTFPTQAERALADWHSLGKPGALVTFAEGRGATREDESGAIVLVFDDDTAIRITGRGQNHTTTTELP